MKTFRLVLLAVAALLPLAGCRVFDEWRKGSNDKGQLAKDLQPEKFVAYVNDHAARLQSVAFTNVRVSVQDRSGALPSPSIPFTGDLFASQPKNFCLVASQGLTGAKVYLGSNDQQFWVYAKVPTAEPMYVFASHTDFAEGRAKIPGGIPFEPEWVMQALGMYTLPPSSNQPGLPPGTPTNRYSLKTDDAKRTFILSWPAVTPAGMSVIKEIVFDGDPATGTRPQVKRHVVRDAKTNMVICFADIKAAKTWPDPNNAQPGTPQVQYPTKVALRWEEPAAQRFEMDLEVVKAQINQPLPPEEARLRFTRPNVPDAKAINLASAEFPIK